MAKERGRDTDGEISFVYEVENEVILVIPVMNYHLSSVAFKNEYLCCHLKKINNDPVADLFVLFTVVRKLTEFLQDECNRVEINELTYNRIG